MEQQPKQMWTTRTRRIVLTGLSVLLVAGGTSWAADEEGALSTEQRLEKASQAVGQLVGESVQQTKQDIELVRNWVSQGQAFVASEKEQRARFMTERAEGMIDYIQVKHKRVAAEAEARSAVEAAEQAKAAAEKAKQAAEEAREQMTKLESQGL